MSQEFIAEEDIIKDAADLTPNQAEIIDNLKDQLLIVFLKRLGGDAVIPLDEINDTGQDLFSLRVDEDRNFRFKLSKKE